MEEGVGLGGLFSGWHFNREIVISCVRRYVRFELPFRDFVEIMVGADSRGRVSIMRCVRRHAPEFKRRSWRSPIRLSWCGQLVRPYQGPGPMGAFPWNNTPPKNREQT